MYQENLTKIIHISGISLGRQLRCSDVIAQSSSGQLQLISEEIIIAAGFGAIVSRMAKGTDARRYEGRDAADLARDFETFDLQAFFPYLVRLFYQSVTSSVSNIYTPLYGLSVTEWRTMVVLGPRQAMSASEIVARSSMDKVAVSRAIKGLREAGFLKRDIDGDDRRRAVLRLTENGVTAYRTLIPLVRRLEDELLEGFSAEEQRFLLSAMERVRRNAEQAKAGVAKGEATRDVSHLLRPQ